MMRCKEMLSVFALVAPFAVGLGLLSMSSGPAVAGGSAPDLCLGTGIKLAPGVGKGGCVYSSTDVPLLAEDVCWDGSAARLKGTAPCVGNERAYHAKHGIVLDPQTGLIEAYAPLQSSCNVVACEPSDVQSQAFADGVACCDPDTGECSPPDANGNCSVGDITWCKEVEDNGDGTVTCHE